MYIDGELLATTGHSVPAINDDGFPVHVGYNAQADFFAEAVVDKVHVYNYALSTDELRTTRDDPSDDAVLWYDLNSFYDSSL